MSGHPAASTAPLLISLQDAAVLLGVPSTTLRDWCFRGLLRVVKPGDCRRWWLIRSEVVALVERHAERLT
jgi:excisionase family DNA binding protein